MKTYSNKICSLAFALFFFAISVNAQKYYLPDEGELLIISEAGDLKFSTVFPGEGLYSTQLGYSPIPHLSLVGSFIHDKSNNQNFGVFGPFNQSSKGYTLSGAIGTYIRFDSKKVPPSHFFLSPNVTMQQGFLLDLYAGYGYGQINNFYDRAAESHFDTHKIYVQAGAHWTFRIGTISFALRAVRLDYKNGSAKGSLDEEALRDLFQGGIQDNNPFSFYESSFRYQIGIKQVRIYTGFTTKYKQENARPNNNKRVIITAGLIVELDELFKKRKLEEPTDQTD